jgi:RNA polymerase-binding transcription factor DksA
MKATCARCGALREMNYPTSRLEEGGFVISGKCAVCDGYLEQKRRVVLA